MEDVGIWVSAIKAMSVLYDCQRTVEEDDEDEDDEAGEETEIPRTVPKRQVAKRRQITLYEKMAAVWQIQRNIKVSDMSIQAAYRIANLHHKQYITWEKIHFPNAGEAE